jgi:hypothetical protein
MVTEIFLVCLTFLAQWVLRLENSGTWRRVSRNTRTNVPNETADSNFCLKSDAERAGQKVSLKYSYIFGQNRQCRCKVAL